MFRPPLLLGDENVKGGKKGPIEKRELRVHGVRVPEYDPA